MTLLIGCKLAFPCFLCKLMMMGVFDMLTVNDFMPTLSSASSIEVESGHSYLSLLL